MRRLRMLQSCQSTRPADKRRKLRRCSLHRCGGGRAAPGPLQDQSEQGVLRAPTQGHMPCPGQPGLTQCGLWARVSRLPWGSSAGPCRVIGASMAVQLPLCPCCLLPCPKVRGNAHSIPECFPDVFVSSGCCNK